MSGGDDTQTSTTQQTSQIPAWMDTASQNYMGAAGNVLANNQINPLQTGAWGTSALYGSMAPGALGQSYNTLSDNANFQANSAWLSPLMSMLGGGSSMGTGLGMSGGGSGGVYSATYDPAAVTQVDMSQIPELQARSFLDYNVGDYMSPYTTNVIDGQLGDIERSRRAQGNNDAARAAGAGAFGGSRSAIVDAVTNSEYDRNSQMASAQLRDQAYRNAQQMIGQDIATGTQTDQFNASSILSMLGLNANLQNAGDQFNAGQANQLDMAQIGAQAQRDAAGMSANASMYGANASRYGHMLDAAATLAQLGLGADLNAATLRGNTANQLMQFGQNGMGAMGDAGNAMYTLPQRDLSWYGQLLGGLPGANTGTMNSTTTGPGEGSGNDWAQWAALAGNMYMNYAY